MLVYFSIIFFSYYLFVLVLLYGWSKSGFQKISEASGNSGLFISVVIAVRNEAKNITTLLQSLESQTFPKERFEVIVVDDGSEDDTAAIIEQFISICTINLKLVSIDENIRRRSTHKKAALATGIARARGSIIATTDGDCWMCSDWLHSLAIGFQDPKTMFVSGPVAIRQGSNLFSRIQTLEFSSLIGSGAALIRLNYPLMCNGANLAFRKDAFEAVGGYDGVAHHASGDDVFLMQKIHAKYLGSVAFVKDVEAIVFTHPAQTLRELLMQRRRWASKWNTSGLPLSWTLPVFLFVHYLSFLVMLMLPALKPELIWHTALFILTKCIIDFLFLKKVMKFCNLQMGIGVFLASEMVYPVYALIIGVMVHFGSWTWKDRKHKT
jgi:cellulose synthase/poly-beta-1,6-N-acetylglucosamine synthase-like glycosyltransferase